MQPARLELSARQPVDVPRPAPATLVLKVVWLFEAIEFGALTCAARRDAKVAQRRFEADRVKLVGRESD